MSFLLILSIFLMLFSPVPVNASGSFSDVSVGVDYGGVRGGNSTAGYWINYWEDIEDPSYFRACNFIVKVGNTYYFGVRYFSDVPFSGYRYEVGSSSHTSVNSLPYSTSSGLNYEGYSRYISSGSASYYYHFENSFPVLDLRNEGSYSSIIDAFKALSDIVLSDIPVINYGDPVSYYSVDVAGSGAASVNNRDIISWEAYDSNLNELPSEATVSIRVIPGTYEADSQANIFKKTYQDFKLDILHIHDLGTFPASSGSVSFTWGEIIDNLDNFADNFNIPKLAAPWVENAVWKLWGWSYEVRLNVGSYSSSWITIYSATSSGVENSQSIINSTEYNYSVYKAFSEITTINNYTTNNYTYGGDNITTTNNNINNETNDPDGDQKTTTFWDWLLNILRNMWNSIKDIISTIQDFFSGDFSSFSSVYEEASEEFLDRTGFNYVFPLFPSIKEVLEGASAVSSAPVLHYPGYSFQNISVIPSIDLDFNFIYDPISEGGLGFDKELVYSFTDFSIYFSLFLFLIRKFKEVMR